MVLIETFDDYMVTFEKVSQALRTVPNLRGIYMASHSLTACVDAIRMEHKQKDIVLLSNSITDTALKYLKSGKTDYCMTANFYQQGYQPLIILQEYLQKHKSPEQKTIHCMTEIICAENLNV